MNKNLLNIKTFLYVIIEICIIMLLILSCYSMILRSDLISSSGRIDNLYIYILLYSFLIAYFVININVGFSYRELNIILIESLVFVIVISLQFFITSMNTAIVSALELFGLLIFFQLFLMLANKLNRKELFLRKFVLIVTLFALISLLLWIFGTLLDLLPYSYVNTDWNNTEGIFYPVKSYFNLLFEGQFIDAFNHRIIRNCGIFPEAPMYGFVLAIALMINVLMLKKESKLVSIILILTIVSTISYTAIVCAIFVLISKVILYFSETKNYALKSFYLGVITTLILVGFYVVILMFDDKVNTNSYAYRSNDIMTCINIFLETIIGCGFGQVYDYSHGTVGLSTGYFRFLAEMGVLFGWFPIYAAIVHIRNSSTGPEKIRAILFQIVFFLIYIFTQLPYNPLVLLILALPLANRTELLTKNGLVLVS